MAISDEDYIAVSNLQLLRAAKSLLLQMTPSARMGISQADLHALGKCLHKAEEQAKECVQVADD